MDDRLESSSCPFGRMVVDDHGNILAVNDTGARWLGFRVEELVGAGIDLLLEGPARLFFQSQVVPVLKLQGWLEEVYLTLREKTGTRVPILLNASRRTVDDVAFNEFAFVRIWQRARLEDELLRAKKLAEQASDAKTKFLAMMSHELRTPLQTITLGNDMLLHGEVGAITADQRVTIDASESATVALVELIEDILNFARMDGEHLQLAMATVNVDDAIDRADVLVRERFERASLRYERGTSAVGLTVKCDRKRLQQILLNLLNNALKFTPAGGRVTISSRRSGKWGVIEVTDTGPGIPHDQLQRIFEPFVQLTGPVHGNQKSGIGLGLSICRDLAHAMGGDLQVQSQVGVGTTFTLTLLVPDSDLAVPAGT